MSLVLATLVVVGFAAALKGLHTVRYAGEVRRRALSCIRLLGNPAMDDRQKERALRAHSLRLFGLFGLISLGGVMALGLPLSGVWLLDRAGLVSFGSVLDVLVRADFLAATVVAGVAVAAWAGLRRSGADV